jgi:hypothetical protein
VQCDHVARLAVPLAHEICVNWAGNGSISLAGKTKTVESTWFMYDFLPYSHHTHSISDVHWVSLSLSLIGLLHR